MKKVHSVIKFNQNAVLISIYWYQHSSKKKKQKMILKKIFLSWLKIKFLEKLWKMWEKIENKMREMWY